MKLLSSAAALMTLFAVSSGLPTGPTGERQALFFAEQRAGRVGYIGWPPVTCKTTTDCASVAINGSYCMNDKTKVAPFFCHEPEVFIATGLAKPVGVAVDSSAKIVFYNQDDNSGGDHEWPLSVVGMDGKNGQTVIPKLLDPQGISVDTAGKKVYYTEHHGKRIGVVDYDGKNQKVLYSFPDHNYPADVAVDPAANKIFALVESETSVGHKLVTMDLVGNNMTVLKDDIVRSYGLTLDKANKVVYYINGGHGGFIGNVSYDGTKNGTVLEGLDWPYMLDFDPVAKILVFSTTGVGDGVIRTVTTDGLHVNQSLTLGFAPMGVKFGKVPL